MPGSFRIEKLVGETFGFCESAVVTVPCVGRTKNPVLLSILAKVKLYLQYVGELHIPHRARSAPDLVRNPRVPGTAHTDRPRDRPTGPRTGCPGPPAVAQKIGEDVPVPLPSERCTTVMGS
jgi:hypothetical protein